MQLFYKNVPARYRGIHPGTVHMLMSCVMEVTLVPGKEQVQSIPWSSSRVPAVPEAGQQVTVLI